MIAKAHVKSYLVVALKWLSVETLELLGACLPLGLGQIWSAEGFSLESSPLPAIYVRSTYVEGAPRRVNTDLCCVGSFRRFLREFECGYF